MSSRGPQTCESAFRLIYLLSSECRSLRETLAVPGVRVATFRAVGQSAVGLLQTKAIRSPFGDHDG